MHFKFQKIVDGVRKYRSGFFQFANFDRLNQQLHQFISQKKIKNIFLVVQDRSIFVLVPSQISKDFDELEKCQTFLDIHTYIVVLFLFHPTLNVRFCDRRIYIYFFENNIYSFFDFQFIFCDNKNLIYDFMNLDWLLFRNLIDCFFFKILIFIRHECQVQELWYVR